MWTSHGFHVDTTWFPHGHHVVSMWTQHSTKNKKQLCMKPTGFLVKFTLVQFTVSILGLQLNHVWQMTIFHLQFGTIPFEFFVKFEPKTR